MKISRTPKQDGTEIVVTDGKDAEVLCSRVPVGMSVDGAAAALGLRVLGRREEPKGVVAVIREEGLCYRCVKA